jgi:uncharacterized protein YgiM (DUF1202 family)
MVKYFRIQWILLLFLLLFGSGWSAEIQKALSVQVREGQLRSIPSFLGKIVAKASYGERVTLIQDQGDWKKVARQGGVQGWMHASALTTKTIVLKAGAANVQTGASGGEIALAGKGFNEEVEKQYKNLNRDLDYAWVDRMEDFQVSPEEMQAFLKQGALIPAEGGAK